MSVTAGPRIDLTGRTALVTGGARGIGRAIAATLAAAGARVAVNDIDVAAAAEAAEAIGSGAFPAPGDVSDEDGVEIMVAAVDAVHGLDILVNNAGVLETIAPIGRQSLEGWQRVIDVNLRGAWLVSRAASARLKRRGGGAIVNIASVAGLGGFPASHAYGVSKAGLVMLTKTLAGELAKHGIRVNAVAPGVIAAPMLEALAGAGDNLPELIARVPLGRLGEATEVGSAVAFLASDAASYITGAVLPVDGGWIAYAGAGPAFSPRVEPAKERIPA